MSHRLVSFNMPMLEELRAQLGATAKLRRTTMQDLLHELLCRALDRNDLLEHSPGVFTRRDGASAPSQETDPSSITYSAPVAV